MSNKNRDILNSIPAITPDVQEDAAQGSSSDAPSTPTPSSTAPHDAVPSAATPRSTAPSSATSRSATPDSGPLPRGQGAYHTTSSGMPVAPGNTQRRAGTSASSAPQLTRKSHSKRTKRIALAFGGVVLLAALAAALWFFTQGSSSAPWNYDATSRIGQAPNKTPEEIQAELNRVVEEGMFNISIASVVDFADPGAPGSAFIENVPGNRYDMVVSITLDTTGEQVYQSGAIAPGSFIESIELTQELIPGNHEATATFSAHDRETHELVGNAAAKVVLAIGEG